MTGAALVLGASGFLGSHVVRHLAGEGRRLRAFARQTSDCRLIEGLAVERATGDIKNRDSLAAAMQGIDTVFHCIVDTRAWLRDAAPLIAVNIDGLRNALEAARDAGVRRYVLTSSYCTIKPCDDRASTEADHFDGIAHLPAYVRTRIEAERLFFALTREMGMEGMALCIATTYGADDVAPTPQGQLLTDVLSGRLRFHWDGGAASLGIEDAAAGMVLAADRGRPGERYILSERWISYRELFEGTLARAGIRRRLWRFPPGLMKAAAIATEAVASRLDLENRFNVDAIRCSNELGDCLNDKAKGELGWQPRPLDAVLDETIAYFKARL
ncbi:NAD-dependent epimerase/dehydratase family protein [Zavarzinia compransoris]|uniref:NAD-dependent epimerase/dehydratase family protein n=1 Tax=Zavarzinia marina TaxID=2911065 RepID=UPI001F1ADE67|nr:NAD-dependent epimerase/dehydratase family protein [Zavarzinia marina]MCF4166687.1 NAD-dependent epimerase/dehydratase family protein [Zavarzinia marina]